MHCMVNVKCSPRAVDFAEALSENQKGVVAFKASDDKDLRRDVHKLFRAFDEQLDSDTLVKRNAKLIRVWHKNRPPRGRRETKDNDEPAIKRAGVWPYPCMVAASSWRRRCFFWIPRYNSTSTHT